jgi:TolB-like protein/tetratricopeptide (TPR) repeat protein/DNA-binding winged helix-turn-helix (wHTH) protein
VRAQLLRGFFLGNVQVEPLKGLVSGHGASIPLSPEALDVLLHLASQPGETLLRDEIIDGVWGMGQGSQEALNRSVSELLLALGDDPDDPRFIETLPNRGYRLIADIEVMKFPVSDQSLPPDPSSPDSSQEDASGIVLLWHELMQRKVVRVGIGYLIASWLILQISDVISVALSMPIWTMKLLTLLLSVGFIITVVVSWLVQVTPAGIVMDKPGNKFSGNPLRHFIELGIILVLLVVISIMVYRQIWSPPAVPSPQLTAELAEEPALVPAYERSIAVLPFINIGTNPADKYFGDGLAEELLHKLARIKSLKVAARTSSFSFGGKGVDIPTIAKQLQVMTVLEGSVRRQGDRMRVTAQLVDAEGFHLWSDVFDQDSDEILDVQSEIALRVAKRIMTSLSPDATARLAQKPTRSTEAFDAYLKGLDYLRQPRQSDSLSQAADYFDQALELDPRFARAFAASCETELAWFRLNRSVEHFEHAERQCNRALTLDSELVEVYTALGNLYRVSSQFEHARELFEQAIGINPYNEEATYGLARSLQGLGDLKGAERLLRQCIELEPGYWGPYLSMGNFLHLLGRYEEAVPFYLKVTELTPENPDGYTNLGSAYFGSNDWEKAETAFQKSLKLASTTMAYRNIGTIYYYQGRYQEAAAMHQQAVELAPQDHWSLGKLAATYQQMEDEGEKSRATYEKAIELASDRLKVEPADAMTMAYLASYLVSVGEQAQAREYAARAVELEPDNPEVWYFSGLVNMQVYNQALAIDDLARAVELGYSRRLLAADPKFVELSEIESFKSLIQ